MSDVHTTLPQLLSLPPLVFSLLYKSPQDLMCLLQECQPVVNCVAFYQARSKNEIGVIGGLHFKIPYVYDAIFFKHHKVVSNDNG